MVAELLFQAILAGNVWLSIHDLCIKNLSLFLMIMKLTKDIASSYHEERITSIIFFFVCDVPIRGSMLHALAVWLRTRNYAMEIKGTKDAFLGVSVLPSGLGS